ncbi:MAG: Mut7-C RNAse domain-containing protein, partial [Candidatus Promineifilaceae bacterium]
MVKAYFRFKAELNDFLPQVQREKIIPYEFAGRVAVKHAIEAMGVPHPEVQCILAGNAVVDFSYLLRDGEEVEVFPGWNEISDQTPPELRPPIAGKPKFIVDGHLGQLAVYLRLLGFDASYENDIDDADMVQIAEQEGRVILTRDVRLLMRKRVIYGYWLRSKTPRIQIREVLQRYQLAGSIIPWHRCLRCNGKLQPAKKEAIWDRLEPLTKIYYDEFH